VKYQVVRTDFVELDYLDGDEDMAKVFVASAVSSVIEYTHVGEEIEEVVLVLLDDGEMYTDAEVPEGAITVCRWKVIGWEQYDEEVTEAP
jgi:hypothetical protein